MPAKTTASRNISNAPRSCIAVSTITANPAAGPLTPKGDPLSVPTTIPPTMPAMIPEKRGAPEAKAIPRHNGTATKNTIRDAGRSLLICAKCFFMITNLRMQN